MSLLDGHIDKNTPIPLYFQLKQLILNEIKEGHYTRGSMIPTEEEISTAFHISRTTVRQAITELVKEGWLYRVKSKGTFVERPKINQDFIQKLESYNDQMKRLGMRPKTEVLDSCTVPAKAAVAAALGLHEGDMVLYIERKRYANDDPIVTVQTYLPLSCQQLLEHDLSQESIYTILSASPKTEIRYVKRTIEAVEATEADAQKLDMKKGKPILLTHTIGYNCFNEPLEYSSARYCGNKTVMNVTVSTSD